MELYQEYAIGTTAGERGLYDTSGTPFFKRNTYRRMGVTGNEVSSYIPQYESLQIYTKEDNEYVPVDLKFLAFDLDSSSTLEAIIDAKKFITWLELYGILDYKIFWSGSKGIHITISWDKLGVQYDSNTPKALGILISKFIGPLSGVSSFDTSIYNNRSLFRVPNTRNIKTGLYKIQLSKERLWTGDIGEIEITSKSPKLLFETPDDTSNYSSLARLYTLAHDICEINQAPVHTYTDDEISEVDFVEEFIANNYISPGNRHQISLVLATYYRARGFTELEAFKMLSDFMTTATGSTTPIQQRLREAKNDVRTCFYNNTRFSYMKAKEILK